MKPSEANYYLVTSNARATISKGTVLINYTTKKPFPCNFCHQLTLRICLDTRIKDNNLNLINCCKECQKIQNGAKETITISTVCKKDDEVVKESKI